VLGGLNQRNIAARAHLLDQNPSFSAMRAADARNGLTFARIWVKDRIRLGLRRPRRSVRSARARGARDWRSSLSKTKRLTRPKSRCRAFLLAAALSLCSLPCVQAQVVAQSDTPPPQGVSRGENFSAKPPAQLFASDCTGAGCHKGPQGLGKNSGIGGLAGFLREHYTNSRESAAALANYLNKLPSGPEPREARTPRSKPAPAAAASESPAGSPNETRASRQNARSHRAAARPDDEPVAARHTPAAEPAESPEKPAEASPRSGARRGRQPATATAAAPPAQSEPEAAAPAAAASAPPAAAPAPAPSPASKQYDIFD
jgi:hypothetical protein